jgi:hypothetical protein
MIENSPVYITLIATVGFIANLGEMKYLKLQQEILFQTWTEETFEIAAGVTNS